MSGVPIRSAVQLAELRSRLDRLPEVEARIAARVAEDFSELARQAFDARTSVDGSSFGKGSDGKPITLDKSGKLRAAATSYSAVGTRVRVSVAAVSYGRYQLRFGLIPSMNEPLPPTFAERLNQIAREELARHFGGAA